jgi:hypothetical protein
VTKKNYLLKEVQDKKGGSLKIGDCLIEVTTWAGLTIFYIYLPMP